jgi:hypothetical protein
MGTPAIRNQPLLARTFVGKLDSDQLVKSFLEDRPVEEGEVDGPELWELPWIASG